LEELIENIVSTASSVSNIELLVKQDDDDWYVDITCSKKYWLPGDVYIAKRTDYLNRDYYNWLAERAKGKYLWAIGDDVRFLTHFWDIQLEEKIEEYLKDKKDRIAYISVNEISSKASHPCFPLITREAFMATGMYFHPELMSWGADRCLWELYNGVNRVLNVPEVIINHLSYHDGKGEYDEVAKSMRDRFFKNPNCHNEVSEKIIPGQIVKLKEYINARMEK
jgi:hypothetical protein